MGRNHTKPRSQEGQGQYETVIQEHYGIFYENDVGIVDSQ